ncbi:hypothetical protein Tco_0871642, partial [Tanacetum coccineum]
LASSPYRNASMQATSLRVLILLERSPMSPTAVLFDVDTERISIHHCEIQKSITLNVLAIFNDNA